MRTPVVFLALSLTVACDCGETLGSDTLARDGGGGVDAGGGDDAGVGRDASGPTDFGPPRDFGDPERCGDLEATVRDFHAAHPDFESFGGSGATTGLVESMLGADGKPVHAAAGPTSQTTGPDNFDQWYRDVDGVNMPFTVGLALTEESPGNYVYDNSAFFPLADMGFGNEGNPHNFHFTTEIHATFQYRGGEVFTFRGDDDVWVFVNDRLALDLGGLHGALAGTIDFDAQAAELGIEVGTRYSLDVFHAERHTNESNFRIETSIECFILE
ncbi:MAG: fibro-slime domain-containing protein [Sandaracinus sp.]|nr:fibro-slime domain-containing protein [Sandaracinus sp.]|tara:strand:- start:192 stop:1004 length:813 start_codon:yes stop_codon:yes gene_type:complete